MPTTTAKLTPQGLLEVPNISSSLSETARLEAEGVYDVTRTYEGEQSLLLEAHFDRLERSARLENIPLQLDRQAVRGAIRTLLEGSGYGEARLRLAVPRTQPEHLTITLEPYKDFREELVEAREKGVSAAAYCIARRNPRAKTNDWIHEREIALESLPEEIYEALIANPDGELTEGFSSNFYAVKGDCLHTAEKDILQGIARNVLLEVALQILPLEMNPVHLDELTELEEAFITSSGRGIVPIVRINDQVIGSGVPGRFTKELIVAFNIWVEAHLEPI